MTGIPGRLIVIGASGPDVAARGVVSSLPLYDDERGDRAGDHHRAYHQDACVPAPSFHEGRFYQGLPNRERLERSLDSAVRGAGHDDLECRPDGRTTRWHQPRGAARAARPGSGTAIGLRALTVTRGRGRARPGGGLRGFGTPATSPRHSRTGSCSPPRHPGRGRADLPDQAVRQGPEAAHEGRVPVGRPGVLARREAGRVHTARGRDLQHERRWVGPPRPDQERP